MADGPLFLAHYPQDLQEAVRRCIADGSLGKLLQTRYPQAHQVRDDAALYDYVNTLRQAHLRNAPALAKVCFDGNLQSLQRALGTHTRISRVQGGRLKAKREIRIAAVFSRLPEDFLRMIVTHELAHLRHTGHDKAFYALCTHIERDYHRLEFDLRAYLSWRAEGGAALWDERAD